MGDISLRGFHGTSSFAQESIKSRGLDPFATNLRNDHWLGRGVYFFEDLKQAQWWAMCEVAKKHNRGSFPIVYGADIIANANQILNLDDNKEVASFYKFAIENRKEIENFCKKENSGFPILNLEKFKGVFFEFYKREFGIKVVICTFPKDYVRYVPSYPIDSTERQTQKELVRILKVYFKEKQFCVSDKNCIKNCEMVYNGEEAEII